MSRQSLTKAHAKITELSWEPTFATPATRFGTDYTFEKAPKKDPLKQWKLSPVDLASLDKWAEYTRAKEAMFVSTDTPDAPWTVIRSDDKKRARINAMRVVLGAFDYAAKDRDAVGSPDPFTVGPASRVYEDGERLLAGEHDPRPRHAADRAVA